jgi:hypothetical protein
VRIWVIVCYALCSISCANLEASYMSSCCVAFAVTVVSGYLWYCCREPHSTGAVFFGKKKNSIGGGKTSVLWTLASPYRVVQILAVDHAGGYCNYPQVGDPKPAYGPGTRHPSRHNYISGCQWGDIFNSLNCAHQDLNPGGRPHTWRLYPTKLLYCRYLLNGSLTWGRA